MKRNPAGPRAKRRPSSSARNPEPYPRETICAIATPVGEGGIGIVRLSGADAARIAGRIFCAKAGTPLESFRSHTIHLGTVKNPSTGEQLDEVMLALMRGPKTYTRMDTVEVYCHGGALVVRRVLDLMICHGARPAEPGEFTKWAFLNGRIDLTQAEAVMDLIHAKTEASQRAAIAQMDGLLHHRISGLQQKGIQLLAEIEAGMDFAEEDIQFLTRDQIRSRIEDMLKSVDSLLLTAEQGRALREGIATAIIGRPNAGKSSLLNALLMYNRAIVTPVPGTTRDTIEEYLNLEGIPLRIIDTAGLRESEDPVEKEGVSRTRAVIRQADLILLVLDVTQEVGPEELHLIDETSAKTRLLVLNKADLLPEPFLAQKMADHLASFAKPPIAISALTGMGMDNLRSSILDRIQAGMVFSGEHEAIINTRHKALLLDSKRFILNAIESMKDNGEIDLIAAEMRAAVERLGEITGANVTEDLLDRIFEGFCIGK